MRDWRQSTWGDEISLEYGKSLRDYAGNYGPVRVYGSNGPIGHTDKALSDKPGVILGRKGAYRGVEYSKIPFFVIDTAYYVVPKTDLDMRWIYYAIKYHKLGEIDDGSPIPSTTRAAVYVRDLEVPKPQEQKAIAAVLGALDDKIELNRQMNATLEAMARALFKSWFVDFDPVRAKMEGKQPQEARSAAGATGSVLDFMDAATAALFPSRLVPSHLGDIPEGWTVKSLDEVANFLNGLALQKYPQTGDDYLPVIKIAELRQGITNNSNRASLDLPKEYIVEDGDVLFSWSGSLMQVLWAGGRGALNQHLFKVTSNYPKWFHYYWVEQHMPWFRQVASSKATTMGHIQRMHLTQATVLLPNDPVMQAADKMIKPLFQKKLEIGIENKSLERTRDYLLPKLISGDIRIPDAEKFVEAA